MVMSNKEIKNDDLLIYLEELLKQYKIKAIKENIREFPYDYRYVILKEENIDKEILQKVLESYTDEELDFLYDELESNIFNSSFEAVTREIDKIFNRDNDIKVLSNCMSECKKRNLF